MLAHRLSWLLSLSDLSTTWIERNVESVATHFLKRWCHLAKPGNVPCLYLLFKSGGLQLPLLVTSFKRCQVSKYHQLLNLDYKLISKVLANRLRKVLGFVIHPDQTCSIPGCPIHDNCATVRDVIQYCVNTNTDGALISLDQTKMFDRVDWNYLFRVLATFRFGPSFSTWIKILYNDIGSHVIINGFLTSRIELRRGVRQGCPLSPMLYVLCAEPLAAAIRSSPIIRGIPSSGDPDRDTIKVAGYANDLTCFTTSDSSFDALDNVLHTYQAASGALLNQSKSVGLWLGKERSDTPLGMQWRSDQITILGLKFCPSYFDTLQTNWSETLQRLRKIRAKWEKRDMSYSG